MSVNINICAKRQIKVIKTGKIETQVEYLQVWQTPTVVSNKIMEAADPLTAYYNWALETSKDSVELAYPPEDYMCEGEPYEYNPGVEHVKNLKQKIKRLKKDGYDIIVDAW